MSNLFKKVTSAVAGLAIVFSIVSPIAGVSAAYSSLEAANKLATLGVIVDQSANPADYRLGDTLTRREHVKVAMNLASCQAVEVVDTCNGSFSDLDSSDWGCKYAETALANGFVSANAMFNPARDVSKAEALKMIMNATGIEKSSNTMWEAAYVEGAVSAGVVDASFSDYTAAASRGWIFQAAAEAVDLCGMDDATEEDDILGSLLDGLTGDDEDDTTTTEDDTTTTEDDTTDPVVTVQGSAMISLSPETPSNGLIAVGAPRAGMLAFDVTAGSTDVTLEKVVLYHVGLGDRGNVDDVTIYNSKNERVSKVKSFNDNDLDISFNKDVVVKAGETQTFMVTATINGSDSINTTYQIELASLEANVAVSGGPLVGAALTPTSVANAGELSVKANTASDTMTIGEEVIFAGFTLEETKDNEDIMVKSITLHQNGSVDRDYLEDLTLTADGAVVASDLTINSDDELVISLDYTIAADDKIEFELTGTVSGDVGEDVHFEFEEDGDIYAVGASTGFNIGFKTGEEPSTANVATSEIIEGAEIDAVFDRSDIDETKVDADDVLVGTFELTAQSNDYEVTEITVTVTGTAVDGTNGPAATLSSSVIDDLNLGGTSFDSVALGAGPSLVYTFEDITLTQGVTEMLDLEFDVVDNVAYNGGNLVFDIKVTEIEDDENNITYTVGGTNDVNDVMSSNSFSTKSIDVETASFTLTKTSVNNRQLVLGNGIETVLYKGKISVGDSDDVTIRNFDFASSGTVLAGGLTLKDVIDNATLNIGGKTFSAKINTTSVDFTSINADVAAGSDNVEVLLTAVLKDNNGVVNGNTIGVVPSLANIDLEDSDGETVATSGVSVAQSTVTTLLDQGTILVKVLNEVDTDDSLENTVLAGESNVVLAELEIEAEYEDMRVKDLTFLIAGTKDFSDTLTNVSLVSGSKTLASGGIVSYVGGQTQIVFKDDVTFADADDLVDAELVADLNPITGEGDAVTAVAGDIAISATVTASKVTGDNSGDTIALLTTGSVAGETVSVVPTKLVFSVVETLANGSAKVKITADSGNNTVGTSSETPEVTLTQLTVTELSGTSNGYIFYKEGAAGVQGSIAGGSGSKNVTFGSVDVVFDTSHTYVIVPTGTSDLTYSLVLSGLVANYSVNTTPTATAASTTLDSEISLGSRTY